MYFLKNTTKGWGIFHDKRFIELFDPLDVTLDKACEYALHLDTETNLWSIEKCIFDTIESCDVPMDIKEGCNYIIFNSENTWFIKPENELVLKKWKDCPLKDDGTILFSFEKIKDTIYVCKKHIL